MPKTCISSDTPYASAADFEQIIDVNLLGDLVNDDGTEATLTQLASSGALDMALARASGLVEAFALAGQMYTAADLQALTGNAQALLKGIVCGLAIQYLRGRRGAMEPGRYPQYDEAMKFLEMLASGTTIFAFAETAAAGLPDTEVMEPQDYTQGLPTLLTNQTRQWGMRQNRRQNW